MDSGESTSTDKQSLDTNHTVFVCGFIPKRWHNSALLAIIQDLLPEYYVACNGDNWDGNTLSRLLLSNAEAMLFFVNEFTLADRNCLLNLQYAWNLMIPVVMLRPPRTKLVICKRERTSERISTIMDNDSVARGANGRWSLLQDKPTNIVDYTLLQDILHEGYKLSLIYDRLDHTGSTRKIIERLKQVMRPTPLHDEDAPPFYLSPSDADKNDGDPTQLRITRSLGSLQKIEPGPLRTTHQKPKKIPPQPPNKENELQKSESSAPQSAKNSINNAPSVVSTGSSSQERRTSMGSLDDVNSFQETQYLVFPIRNSTKKPTLIKFPEDLMENDMDGGMWGSESSLEEDSEIAEKVYSGMFLNDVEEDSPIGTPAPYIGDL
ncbi:unnamed protein product [Nippostrongylus brasiliensis]|uniref:TIR-like domain-containing protein n=1 Tax=Nippostrongylus brasiliensis TaxID=27835 RepID=A0A0N4XZR7_NIPBR|nr:unnamed protein product [Nippostrongylus brasiliensis]